MTAFALRPSRPRARQKAVTRLRPPPSATLIDAVLEHADLRDELGGGRVLLRISPSRLAETRVRRALGAEAGRAGDVAIIWDEREDVMFRVLDGAPPPLAVVAPVASPAEDRFVLTPAALAYIAQSQSRGRG